MENISSEKTYKEIIIGLVLIIILILTNPDETKHKREIIDDNSKITKVELFDDTIGRLSSNLDLIFSGFEVKNYFLFSLGYDNVHDEYITIGVFNYIILL